MEFNKKNKTEEMATHSIPSLVLRFSASTFAALFFSALYNAMDAFFIGRGVGDLAMGGVSVVFPFMLIQTAIAQTVGAGAASVVSRCLGEQSPQTAANATVSAMAAFYVTAILTTVSGFLLMEPILTLLGATPDILPFAKEYFTVILAGTVFSTGFSSIIRAEGRMTYSFLIWLIPTAINIIFDAVFIFGIGLGVKGAALATVLCQFTSFCMSVLFFTKFSIQDFKGARPSLKTIVEIVTVGFPTLIQAGGLSVVFAFFNNLLKSTVGTLGINTFAYISKLLTFGIVPFTAVTQAISPIIGYNKGANDSKRIRRTLLFASGLCLTYALLGIIGLQFGATHLMRIFTDGTDVLTEGERALKILGCALPFAPFPLLGGAYYQAIGKKLPSLGLYASIPAFLFVLVVPMMNRFGLSGLWNTVVAASILACACTAILAVFEKKRKS